MPAYDYRCEDGHGYERREPFGSPPQHPCERCGKPARRQFHAPTVVFKGGGWYKTESRGKAPAEDDSASSAPAKTGDGDGKAASASGSASSGSGGKGAADKGSAAATASKAGAAGGAS